MSRVSRRLLLVGAGSGAVGLAVPGCASADPVRPESGKAQLPVRPVTVVPSDSRYQDLLFRGYNKRLVSKPEMVRVVGTTEQVVQAVNEAASAGKRVAVRSGGHCLDGLVDNPEVQVVIDFTEMRSVTFDLSKKAFLVEPGTTLGEVYRTLDYGWGVTLPGGVCPVVGMGGHVIGNGFGALSRQHGLIADHLYAVEVVVVGRDGRARAVTATREKSDPNYDLWWAHTGAGGGNFGVATRFWFRSPNASSTDPGQLLPRVPSALMTGRVVWKWSDVTEGDFIQIARNWSTWVERNSAPGARGTALHGSFSAPRQEKGAIVVVGQLDPNVAGNEQVLDDYLAAMTVGVGPAAQVVKSAKLPWLSTTVNVPDSSVAQGIMGQPRWKSKLAYLKKGFSDAQLSTAYHHLTRPDYNHPASSLSLTAYGGQINALAASTRATPHRSSVMLASVGSAWDVPADDEKHLQWNREFYRSLFAETGGVPAPNHRNDGLHVNWPDLDLLGAPWNTSTMSVQQLLHGENYSRLRQIKAKWDPRNFFRHGVSIALP